MSKLYTENNSDYLSKNKTWHIEDSFWKSQQIDKIITRNSLNLNSVMEIGCGAGEILAQLQKIYSTQNITFTGYDIAPDLLAFWETRKNTHLNFFLENPLEKPLHFDLLLMIDVFEHVDDYLGFITKASRLAQYKIFHIPLDLSLLGLFRNMPLYFRKSVGHLHYFTKETALATLEYCGLEIIDFLYTAGSIELHNQKIRTKLMNIPRRLLFKINNDWTSRILGGYSLIVLAK
ncbi:MAG: class I SAM-dependent methyltransferase [Saprospiraceae bacterium]